MNKNTKILMVVADEHYPKIGRKSPDSALRKTVHSYTAQLEAEGYEVDMIELYKDFEEGVFSPVFYSSQPDTKTVEYQIRLRNASGLLVFYNNVFERMPGVMKGFVDKVFTPGFAFAADGSMTSPAPYLDDKMAQVFCFQDSNKLQSKLAMSCHEEVFWKRVVFHQCGITGQFKSVYDASKQVDQEVADRVVHKSLGFLQKQMRLAVA